MDLTQEKNKLEKELVETTERFTKLSFKCKELTAKIKKLDKAIASNKALMDELNADPKEEKQ